MIAMKLNLLSFVVFCLCHHVKAWYQNPTYYSPEKQVEIFKNIVKFEDEHIFERWWATEELTCREGDTVLQILQQNMNSDLSLLMKDAEKHLQRVPPPGNKKMRRCIEDIKEQIEEAVLEGVEHFTTCTSTSLVLQGIKKTEMQKNREKYKERIKYSLESMEHCLEYNIGNDEDHKNKCIIQIKSDNDEQVNVAYNALRDSKCMSHFKNKILNCTSQVYDEIIAKKNHLENDIKDCVGYSSINPMQQNLGLGIDNILSDYADKYIMFNSVYDNEIVDYLFHVPQWLLKQESFELDYHEKPHEHLQAYYDSLKKTREENRSKKERKCYSEAIEKLNNLTAEGTKDYKDCENGVFQKRVKGRDTFTNIVKEFNTKLREAGNVALLRCFGQRPQQIFSAKAIEECAELAYRSINWEWSKAQMKLSILNDSLQATQILPDDKTCGPLRDSKLILDADKIMNECTRCLYGGSGDLYAVTTPSTYTTTPDEQWDEKASEEVPEDKIPEWSIRETNETTTEIEQK